jgi:hypothetical protein
VNPGQYKSGIPQLIWPSINRHLGVKLGAVDEPRDCGFHHLRQAVSRQDTTCTDSEVIELVRGVDNCKTGGIRVFRILDIWLASIEAGTQDTSFTEGGLNLAGNLSDSCPPSSNAAEMLGFGKAVRRC